MTGFMQPAANPWTGQQYGAPLNPNNGVGDFNQWIPSYGNSNFLQDTTNQAVQTFPGMGGGVPGAGGQPSFMQGLVGNQQAPGWGGMALGAAQGLAGAYMGMQQFGLAKKTLKENKRQFELNFGAQRKTTNTALEDRQRARVASNPGAYESVGAYMNQNGI